MSSLGLNIAWIAIQVSVLCCLAIPIYLLVRRRSPLAGATAALSALLLAVMLTVAGFIPWPHLQLESMTAEHVPAAAGLKDSAEQGRDTGLLPVAGEAAAVMSGSTFKPPPALTTGDYLRFFADSFREQPASTGDAPEQPMGWSDWVAVMFVGGGIGSLLWYGFGMVSVIRLRLRSVEILDPQVLTEVSQVSRQINVSRAIGVRECRDLSCAATTGWARPLILLPADWRTWSPDERRSVLAHEIAHIHHRDFPLWLVAQIGVILHFYHPLMHWLASRLRLEQELAADALAAQVTGGSNAYLNALARLALRQSDSRVAWPARTFLPGKGTLMRRVEMLKSSGFTGTSAARVRRLAAALTMITVALLVSAVQRPGAIAAASESPASATTTSVASHLSNIPAAEELDLSYVPTSTWAMVGLNVDQLTRNEQLKPLVAALESQIGKEKSGIALTEFQQVLGLAIIEDVENPVQRGPQVGIFTTKEAQSFEKLIPLLGGNPNQSVDREVAARTERQSRDIVFYRPDDRTIIIGQAGAVRILIREIEVGSHSPSWKRDFTSAAAGNAAIAVDMRFVRGELNRELGHLDAVGAAFSPLWMDPNTLVGHIDLSDKASIHLRATCADASSAERVASTLSAVAALGENMLRGIEPQLERAPARERAMLYQLTALGSDLLKSREIASDGKSVNVTLSADGNNLPGLIAMTLPAVTEARGRARQMQSSNNLKQIGIAMHNYHDAYGHFPASAVKRPGDSESHSWRVALLPFLEQAPLYDQYRFDEPWDSASNMKILEQMPPVFAAPSAEPSTNSSYYVVVGDDTGFNGTETGRRLREFRDGTSNSILTVEAKRDIPWTKPADIPLPEEGVPELGGFDDSGFNVGFADASVHFVSQGIDAELLRKLFTIQDGEPVSLPGR